MNDNQQQFDTIRRFPRYQTMDRALALIAQPPAVTPYHIIDISEGGLAFRYLGEKVMGNDIAVIDLCYNETLYVKGVPVKSVADCWTGSHLTDIRRKCISFEHLSVEQREQLELFIKLYSQDQLQ